MLSKYTKSIVAALVAGLGSLQVALVDNVVSTTEWITVGSAVLAALGFVWGVANTKEPAEVPAEPAPVPDVSDPGVESVHLTNGFE
jgi:hypothetical protein